MLEQAGARAGMTPAGVPFSAIRRQTAGAVRQGIALDDLLSRSLIDLQHGDDRDLVDPAHCILLCCNTVLALGDAAHGLATTRLDPRYPAIGLMIAQGCPTLESAIGAVGRLYSSACSAIRIQLRSEGDKTVLSVHVEAADARDGAYLEENFLVWMFMQCLQILGHPPPVIDVTLRDPLHFSIGRVHWGIKGPVRHGDLTAFRFPRSLLRAQPVQRSEENVVWACHRLWLSHVDRVAPGRTATDFVTDRGFVRFTDLVRCSGLSSNTLRRRYKAAAGRFRDVRQQVLVDAATTRLVGSDDSVEDIAAELGYSDGRSFRRFLKTATGMTPQQVRLRGTDLSPLDPDPRTFQEIKALSERMSL